MKKILIIDDLKSDLLLIKNILKTHLKDITIYTSGNGLEGLQKAKSHLPDAIILDIYMPDLSGLEVAKRLKKHPDTQLIPIIMLTANYGAENSMSMALNAGAQAFLYKPINRIELIAQLKTALRLKAAEDRLIENNKRLKQSEASFRNMITYLPIAYALHVDGKVTLVNQKAIDLLGAQSEQEIIGKSIVDFLHPDVLQEELEKLQKFYAPDIEFMSGKTIMVKLNGEPITVELNARKLFYQGKTAIQLTAQDISQKEKREQEREQLLTQLEISEALSNSGSWRFNLLEEKIYFSKNLLKIFEITEKELQNATVQALQYIHPEDVSKFVENIEKILRHHKDYDGEANEYRIITKTKTLKYVVNTTKAYYNKQGKVIEIIGIVKDLTPEKLTKQKLIESEERFGIAFELSPYAIIITDSTTLKIVAVNENFQKFSGYTKEEAIGKDVLELNLYYHPEDRDRFIKQLKKNNGKVTDLEMMVKTKDGEILESLVASQTFRYENNEFIFSIIHNIKKLKNTQRELEQRRQKLKQYISVAQVILLVLNKEGNIELINKKGSEILGLPEKELIGKNWFDHFLPKEEVKETKKIFTRILNGEAELFNGHENLIVNAKGEKRLILWNNALLKDDEGTITGILSSGEDITEKKQHQEELKLAKEKALESDRLKSAFLANMSHEIRTPMNAIIGFAQLLKEPDFSPEEKDNFVDIITKSGKNLLDLINQIIDISKIEAGKVTLTKEKTNLNKVNREIADMFQIMAASKKIELRVVNGLKDTEATIITDTLKLKEILTNLVSNAVKYTKKGYVEIRYTVKKNSVQYCVEDTGCGIPQKSLPYIFERFRKVVEQGHPVEAGAGLGLCIVKSYLELMGGTIKVQSKVGKGSKFLFTLPYKTKKKRLTANE